MGILQLNPHSCWSSLTFPSSFNPIIRTQRTFKTPNHLRGRIRAVGTISGNESQPTSTSVSDDEPPTVDFAFVSSVLLPDGTLDVHTRSACGGQKLRDIMLDNNIDLYGPYVKPLFNCGGGGTCGTCMVEIVKGKELLSPRTDKEKEKLKRKPKNWRLACQATVGRQDSKGEMIVQQLPEWKAHEWTI